MKTHVRGSLQGPPVVAAGKAGLEANDGRLVEEHLRVRTGVCIRYRMRVRGIGNT